MIRKGNFLNYESHFLKIKSYVCNVNLASYFHFLVHENNIAHIFTYQGRHTKHNNYGITEFNKGFRYR